MKYFIIIFGFLLFNLSCKNAVESNVESNVESSFDKDERKSLESYVNNVLVKNNYINKEKNFVFYLIVRDCYCVEENINFIKKELKTIEAANVVIIVKTIKGQDEILNNLSFDDTILLKDFNNQFEEYGNIYATDKFFIIENHEIHEKFEFKKENFDLILSKLNN